MFNYSIKLFMMTNYDILVHSSIKPKEKMFYWTKTLGDYHYVFY